MKRRGFVIGILAFMSALCFGCQNASSDMKIILHDQPELKFKYSKTPIKGVVVWYFTDDPGGHLRIYWSGQDEDSFDLQLSREAIEQVAKTKQVVVELDGGTSKTLPVTISNNKYSRNDRLLMLRP